MLFRNRQYLCRSGPQDRIHHNRYTYITGVGWFVYLRGDQEMCCGVEVSSGLAGPFETKSDARGYLTRFINKTHRGLH
jgi:hypothetical protein